MQHVIMLEEMGWNVSNLKYITWPRFEVKLLILSLNKHNIAYPVWGDVAGDRERGKDIHTPQRGNSMDYFSQRKKVKHILLKTKSNFM